MGRLDVTYRIVSALAVTSLLAGARVASATEESWELPTDPLLASLIAQSLAGRPELGEAQARARAERERIPQARAIPDPMLQVGAQNDGFTRWQIGTMETSWYQVMASQTLPWPGKRGLRGEVASLAADQADRNTERARLSTEADVRRAYLDLVLARDRLALLDQLETIWQRATGVTRSRYETGQGSQSEVMRAQLELNRIRQRRWTMQGEAATAQQALNRFCGQPLDAPIVTTIHLAELPLPQLQDERSLIDDALARSPELATARLATRQSHTALQLAHKSYYPDVTVTLGIMPRGGTLPTMWLASLAVPLPVYAGAKQSRNVAENEARSSASEHGADEIAQALRLRTQQRRTALAVALDTIGLYSNGLLVQSQATAESTLAQYEVGRVTFIAVLEANAGFIADQDGYLQALAQAHRLEIERVEVSLTGAAIPTPQPAVDLSAKATMEASP